MKKDIKQRGVQIVWKRVVMVGLREGIPAWSFFPVSHIIRCWFT